MRIVQLLPNLNLGGMERLAVDLARQQKADGHLPSIYCTEQAGTLAPDAIEAGVPIETFGKKDGFSPSLILRLARKLHSDCVDVLHAHNALVLHYAVAAARLANVRAVINTRHGGNLRWDPHCENIWRRTVPWADAIVFISEGVRDHFVARNRLARKNTHVIYNGLKCEKFSARSARPGQCRPRIRFGAVGRLVPAKAHKLLTEAFSLIATKLPHSELHILGDGPCRTEIEQTSAALGLKGRVILHGASRDVAGFLSNLDIFVLSSIDEGLPISLMEAMAAGLPIVSTQLPGLRELAPEHVVAAYCEPGAANALAEAMFGVANRADLGILGCKAQEWSTRFSISETAKAYETLFESVLCKKHLRPKSAPSVEPEVIL